MNEARPEPLPPGFCVFCMTRKGGTVNATDAQMRGTAHVTSNLA